MRGGSEQTLRSPAHRACSMKRKAALDDSAAEHVQEVLGLTESWLTVLDRVGEQRIGGEADAGEARVWARASTVSSVLAFSFLAPCTG